MTVGGAAVGLPAVAAETARISGTVTGIQADPDIGFAAALVSVYAVDDSDTPVAVELVTGSGGYQLDVPAGTYLVSARTEARATEWWPEVGDIESATPVDLSGGASADLDFTLDVPAASFTIDPTDVAQVSGLGEPGTTLTVDPGTFAPQPDSFSYQWARGTAIIPGATGPTITAGQPPQNLFVAVTPHRAGYSEWPVLGSYSLTAPVAGLAELLTAMDPDPETHVSDRLSSFLPARSVVPAGIAVGTRPIRGFPTQGDSYAVLSTGVAAQALQPGDSTVELSTDINSGYGDDLFFPTDETRVRLTVAPPAGSECLAVDLMFGSEENPIQPVPTELDYLSVESPTASDEDDGPPENNFARSSGGGSIGVGSALSPEPDWSVNGWTQPFTARVPLSGESIAGPGYSDVVISVLDMGDSYLDSVLLVDNLRFEPASGCPADGVVTPIEEPAPVIEGTAPEIGGQARIGSRLTADPGDWGPAGVILSYQWLRNGQPIAGATAQTYVPKARDLLSRISVRVTGSLAGAEPVALVSAPTARVGLPR